MLTHQIKIGPLKAHTVGNLQAKNLVIFLHGYGANSRDLYPLHELLLAKTDYAWIFPEAPIHLDSFPGYEAKAWFDIDASSYQKAIINKDFSDLKEKIPDGMKEASHKIHLMLESLNKDPKNITLGGFSQGAMIALDYVLRYSFTCSAICLLSGSLTCFSQWKKWAQKIQVPFFQSHGKNDPILPYELSLELEKMLREASWNGEISSFNGGHEIPLMIQNQLKDFLQQNRF